MKEFNFLKIRAQEFWMEGKRLFEEGKYNLSAFNLEQAVQLWIKYLLGIKVGDWPKTHYLSELIKELSIAYENNKVIEFYQENELFFNSLEDAYFTTRYFPKEFTKNLVNTIIDSCNKFFKFIENNLGEKFLNE